MASELNMYESQVSEYRMDIDRLQREMQEVKKKYFLQKKKRASSQVYINPPIRRKFTNCIIIHREKDRALAQSLGPPVPNRAELPRFTGGGFNLKQTQKAIA